MSSGDDPELLGRVLIGTPDGAQIPLSQVVNVHSRLGPPMIRSEGGKLVGFVFVDTDRPIADYVADAKRAVSSARLPPGARVDWVGQFKYFERAKQRLQWVIPLTLGIVFLLLYFNTRSMPENRARDAGGAVLTRRRDLAPLPYCTIRSASRFGWG